MKMLLLITLALAVFCALAPAQPAAAGGGTKKESPFACDRLALAPAARARHFDVLGPMLVKRRLAVHELADGYEFQFSSDPETMQLVAEWVAGEHLCCPFFDFEMRVEREGGPFWLRLTGRPGTKQFIQADGANWIRPVQP